MTAPAPVGRRRLRWPALTALVTLVWVVAVSIALVVLDRDPTTFARLADLGGNVAARLALCGVVAAAVHHGFDGLRVGLADLVPATRGWDGRLRLLTRFAVGALAIPAAVVILWPAVSR